MRFRSHQSWFPKEVDLPNDYEDASARSEKTGRAVIADGVSSAIFSRTWARLLTRTAVATPPSVGDDAAIMQWVSDLQKLWREGINFQTLPWNLKPKAASTGAQATLLLIDLEPGGISNGDETHDNAATKSGDEAGLSVTSDRTSNLRAEYRLQAHALGDCNLFLIRDGEKILSFPMTNSAAFAAPPDVFSSIAKNVAYAAKFQHLDDRCREGDLLVACTDAIGLWAMQEYEAGRQVDWMRYWGHDEAWQADIQHYRGLPAGSPRRMRIDDCTLLLLQVVADTVIEAEPDVQPDRSDEPFVLHVTDNPELTDKVHATELATINGELLEDNGDAPVDEVDPAKALIASEPAGLSEVVTAEKVTQESGSVEIAAPASAPDNSVVDAALQTTTPTSDTNHEEKSVDASPSSQKQPIIATATDFGSPAAVAGMEAPPDAVSGDEQSPAAAQPKNWFAKLFPN